MSDITREQLHAYLDDALDDSEAAKVEKALRDSGDLQKQLRHVREERDRGEHSLGGVWRRERLSCLTREQLTGFIHGVLDAGEQQYIEFHLKTIACTMCLANTEDLREKLAEPAAQSRRRKRYYETSAGMLNQDRK
jgi:hypothetical protein